ncbi:aspartate carbamoyltransferase catalytic subunit [Selenomonas sp. F0473]|uniref:aspartate carbamoyltransferase catalytic subunit n=1 Tax=Selenomonas sp. F0473 TaxID=999423 RepID=UPI00029EC0FB|nr:aspartate carbamoyltransferase catalytic subunit [Selenomonas sp. F0473]EKU71602.1 aspartate carbamoyltransferase [Selenomonas sp. F0473]
MSRELSLKGRDILALEDFSAEEIRLILNTAKEMKNIVGRDIKKVPALRGKSIVTLFYEPSTRTRTSFELAGKYLGADVVNITSGTSSIVKGESLRDTLYTIEAMGVDAIVMRHKAEGAAAYAASVVSPVIVNAGDGAHAHPSQGLLNLYTIEENMGKLEGLKVAILGDVLHSRVARSDIQGMRKMGLEIHIAGPRPLLPRFLHEEEGITVHDRVEDAIEDADVVEVLRIQLERMKGGLFPSTREYARIYGLSEERLKRANKNAIVLHPGPMNRGWEISESVAYHVQSRIQEEVKNGVAVRMALFTLALMGGKHK